MLQACLTSGYKPGVVMKSTRHSAVDQKFVEDTIRKDIGDGII